MNKKDKLEIELAKAKDPDTREKLITLQKKYDKGNVKERKRDYKEYFWLGFAISLFIGFFAFLGNLFIKNPATRKQFNKGIIIEIIIALVLSAVLIALLGFDKFLEVV